MSPSAEGNENAQRLRNSVSLKEVQTSLRSALADLGSSPNGSAALSNGEASHNVVQDEDAQREWEKIAPSLRFNRSNGGQITTKECHESPDGAHGVMEGHESRDRRSSSHRLTLSVDDLVEDEGQNTKTEDAMPGRTNGSPVSNNRKELKEKVLKLSPARMEELMSSPDSIPVRMLSNETDRAREGPASMMMSSSEASSDRSVTQSDSQRSVNEVAQDRGTGSRNHKDIHLDDPPKFLISNQRGPNSAPNRHRFQPSRTASSPVLVPRRNSIGDEQRSSQNPTSRPKHKNAPNHIDLGPKNHASFPQMTDPIPSPMPQSIPLPPLSIPTYLQLELSSSRPSPLYIHRSVTSDFPYESSRVKIERLLNFLLLPPALEQVLWFGALACLDAWLYSFTILPLRFLKALYILIVSWALNLSAEVQFVSSFIVKGIGRVWRRRWRVVDGNGRESGKTDHKAAIHNLPGAVKEKVAAEQDGQTRARSDGSRRPRQSCKQSHRRQDSTPSTLLPDDKADILKGFLMISTCIVLMRFDASRMYHWIRGQAAIKLYVIYNVLEVGDRLLSAIGQDVVECLFSREALERKPDGRSKVVRPFWLFILALAYTVLHSTALFYQVITLNVAVNSYSNALITLLLSNQFVEIKSTVFKKFEKENLFQLTCADVVERFQLWLMLTIIASRNIVETGVFSSWFSLGSGIGEHSTTNLNSTPLTASPRTSSSVLPQSFTFLPSSLFTSLSGANSILPTMAQVLGPFLVVLGSEMLVDWLKHAYINKFNNTRPAIYGRFLDVLAKDYYTNAFADQNLTRRLGLPVIPLACLFFRMSVQTYQMFLTAWLPTHASSTPNGTSLSSIYDQYSSSALPSPSPVPSPARSLISSSADRVSTLFASIVNNVVPSPGHSIALFTIILILTGYVILLLFKLAIGVILLTFARARYKAMKNRERDHSLTGGVSSTSQPQPQPQQPRPFQSHGKEHVVEGGRRVGGWGVVEVDDDKRRWIYADDLGGLKKLKEKEERDRTIKDDGGFESVQRYEMVAKRIW
jgi:hypothetical protein